MSFLLAAVPALAAGGAGAAGAGLGAMGYLGLGLSALGTIGGGIAQAQSASAEAAIAKENQQIATQNQAYAIEAGNANEQITGQKAAAQLGAVRASIAANNVDVNSGSAEDVQKSQRETGELSELNTIQNANLQAYGYGTQAAGFGLQSQLASSQAAEAIPGSLLSATGGFLSNASILPNKYSMWSGNSEPYVDTTSALV